MVAIAWTRGRSLRRSVRVGAARGARSKSFRDLPQEGAHANRYNLTSRGAPTSRMGMTTVWRPRVRIAVPDVGDAENTDTSREESTKKGTKRKRAPPTKGPCEHGVKTARTCKVCSRLSARSSAPSMQGVRWVVQSASTVVVRSQCKECGGASICEHGRQRHSARSAVGQSICEHGRQRSQCKECGGSGICEHGRVRSTCKECGGASNLRARSYALSVQGVRWVINLRARSSSALSARSAVGDQSASTVVSAISARSAVGRNLRARSSAP